MGKITGIKNHKAINNSDVDRCLNLMPMLKFDNAEPSNTHSSRITYEAYSSTKTDGTRTKPQSYVQIELATNIPKATIQNTSQSTITQTLRTPQIHLKSKDLEESVKVKCPTADIDRLKNRRLEINGPNQQLLVECALATVTHTKETGDFLYRMKKNPTPLVVKQINTSS